MNPERNRRYVNVLFDEETLVAIDDYRFRGRFASRTEAIRGLISFALDQIRRLDSKKQKESK